MLTPVAPHNSRPFVPPFVRLTCAILPKESAYENIGCFIDSEDDDVLTGLSTTSTDLTEEVSRFPQLDRTAEDTVAHSKWPIIAHGQTEDSGFIIYHMFTLTSVMMCPLQICSSICAWSGEYKYFGIESSNKVNELLQGYVL